MIKRLIIAIVLLVIVCGGIVGFNLFRDQAIQQFFATMKPKPVTVSTFKVEPTSWTPGIEAIGTVSAANGVDLTVETTGIVKDINFSANQRIEQGRVLVQLDDAVQRADLEAGNTQAALDQQGLERARQLQRSGVGTQSTLDTALAAAQTSQSQVARLQAVLDQKQLKAPFPGTTGIPRVDLGQFVQPGTVIATLQNLDTMRVDFSVPEQRLGELSIGQQVSFGLTEGKLSYSGKVAGIDPKIDPSSRLISVRAVISNPNGQLSPGQFVQVRVELPKEDAVIAIPETSLVSSLYGDFVYVVRPAKAAELATTEGDAAAQPPAEPAAAEAAASATPAAPDLAVAQIFVTPGRRTGGMVEILNNLKQGDEIVTAGQNKLTNNTPVVINNSVVPMSGGTAAGK